MSPNLSCVGPYTWIAVNTTTKLARNTLMYSLCPYIINCINKIWVHPIFVHFMNLNNDILLLQLLIAAITILYQVYCKGIYTGFHCLLDAPFECLDSNCQLTCMTRDVLQR